MQIERICARGEDEVKFAFSSANMCAMAGSSGNSGNKTTTLDHCYDTLHVNLGTAKGNLKAM